MGPSRIHHGCVSRCVSPERRYEHGLGAALVFNKKASKVSLCVHFAGVLALV
jgi:hypothetical protein